MYLDIEFPTCLWFITDSALQLLLYDYLVDLEPYVSNILCFSQHCLLCFQLHLGLFLPCKLFVMPSHCSMYNCNTNN